MNYSHFVSGKDSRSNLRLPGAFGVFPPSIGFNSSSGRTNTALRSLYSTVKSATVHPEMSLESLRNREIRLSAPTAEQVNTTLQEPIANCLSAAFSSGPWKATPMPIGDSKDRHSARGIVAELGSNAHTLVATASMENTASIAVVGCVIGSILNENLIGHYGLEQFGAKPGDGLFAYIGLMPVMHGQRLQPGGNHIFQLGTNNDNSTSGVSLASLLFTNWLNLPAISCCPRIFIRTREVLHSIQALATRNGFQYRGKFYLDFQGVRQDRMVYSRNMA